MDLTLHTRAELIVMAKGYNVEGANKMKISELINVISTKRNLLPKKENFQEKPKVVGIKKKNKKRIIVCLYVPWNAIKQTMSRQQVKYN